MPEVGDASGFIYHGDWYAGTLTRMKWDGTEAALLPVGSVVAHRFTVSETTSPRFLLYDNWVASYPSPYGSQPIVNIFAIPETGGTPVNIINDDHFQAWTPCLSVDGSMIAISGAGRWDEELQDFVDIGSYVADLVYGSDGLPCGVGNLRLVCPTLLGSLSRDKTSAAATEALVSGGRADLWVTSVLNGVRTNITNTATLDESRAAWSPQASANRIAYVRPVVSKNGRTQGNEIHTVLPDGSSALAAVDQANSGVAWNNAPTWSPDAGQIAFVAQETATGPAAIMRTAADGSTTAANLTGFTIGRVYYVAWCP
jgi:hypothetical protein